jgi:hypothetical protein
MLQIRVLQPLIQTKHLRDESNDAVVTGFVNRIGEIDGADGSFAINPVKDVEIYLIFLGFFIPARSHTCISIR